MPSDMCRKRIYILIVSFTVYRSQVIHCSKFGKKRTRKTRKKRMGDTKCEKLNSISVYRASIPLLKNFKTVQLFLHRQFFFTQTLLLILKQSTYTYKIWKNGDRKSIYPSFKKTDIPLFQHSSLPSFQVCGQQRLFFHWNGIKNATLSLWKNNP